MLWNAWKARRDLPLYSDGTYAFSQWCFDQLGGDEYLRAEREANTFECDGTVCRNPYTGVTFPDRNAAPSAPTGTTSDRGYSCNSTGCYWPDGTPVINADRCGLLCGEPPTSGDIQTQHGCEEGGRSPIVGPVGSRADSYLQSISRSHTPPAGAGGCIRQRTRQEFGTPAPNDGAGDCGRP